MAKKPTENKGLMPGENKTIGMVRVKILPLRGIGGYGNAGDEVMMPDYEADYYVREGYVKIVSPKGEEE